MDNHHTNENEQDTHQYLRHAIDHLDHVLPGQAPIKNFVHHNTLHGYQHLHFTEALAAAEVKTGARAYLPDSVFRELYRSGRIDDRDLDRALANSGALASPDEEMSVGAVAISRRRIQRLGVVHDLDGVTPHRLQWHIDELGALKAWQPELTDEARQALADGVGERDAVQALWQACARALGLNGEPSEQTDPADAGVTRAESMVKTFGNMPYAMQGDVCPINPEIHTRVQAEARQRLSNAFDVIGKRITLRDLLLRLTGHDILPGVRTMLIRFCASHLDEGLASWHAPDRQQGLYAAWRNAADWDIGQPFGDFPDYRRQLLALPEQALEAISANLRHMGIAHDRWPGYLERLALEIPGWSGIVNWRHHRPGYDANQSAPADLTDFLAIRSSLDRLHLDRLCQTTWGIDASIPALRRYFETNLSEFYARGGLYRGHLPEFLANAVQQLVILGWSERTHHSAWRNAADMIWVWKQDAGNTPRHTLHGNVWRLFKLCQHLGLPAETVGTMTRNEAENLLAALDRPAPRQRSFIWLCAYENHYQTQVFEALSQNHGRGRWRQRNTRPVAQVVFCMDDREESIRRHLEELNPAIETLGAAGFFGVPINWLGLDDAQITPLCPIVVTPSNEVREQAKPEATASLERHRHGLTIRERFAQLLHRELRRNLFTSQALIALMSPFALAFLAGKTLLPHRQNRWIKALENRLIAQVPTELEITAPNDSAPSTPDKPRLGFTDSEQADRVAGFLRTIGLTSGFAPLVVIAGHGSFSQNNPHLAAYDCGACSGRHGGPNARVFTAMANRSEVRNLLNERGIAIPEDTRFIGSEHNTCNEDWLWFDLDDLPTSHGEQFQRLRGELDQSLLLSAHERCRRLASAPRDPSLKAAMKHMQRRAADFSQARPELGHATNAAALIGRRAVTQGAFLDRRVFLISYDPTIDADGKILENILLAAGPVGAGISLEYYFSTVNNDQLGCGTKVPHNVAGFFGVMEGGSSDLRTGLPRQMIEIHEAMRLQVIVEARTETIATIYQRQPPLQELIGNGWILVSAIDPDTGAIATFEPDRGFVPWQPGQAKLPEVQRSGDWYQGHSEPLPPALIKVVG